MPHDAAAVDGSLRPVRWWREQVAMCLEEEYGDRIVVERLCGELLGKPLLRVRDPRGNGLVIELRLEDVRAKENSGVEFTIFVRTRQESRDVWRLPSTSVHVWGADIEITGTRMRVSEGGPWREYTVLTDEFPLNQARAIIAGRYPEGAPVSSCHRRRIRPYE